MALPKEEKSEKHRTLLLTKEPEVASVQICSDVITSRKQSNLLLSFLAIRICTDVFACVQMPIAWPVNATSWHNAQPEWIYSKLKPIHLSSNFFQK